MTGQELARLAMKRCGYSTPSELAKRLDLGPYSSPRRVSRWLDGQTRPNYETTIALLDLVGAINWDALLDPGSRDAKVAKVESLQRQLDYAQSLLDPDESQAPGSEPPGTRSSHRS